MTPDVRRALASDNAIDITTTGAKSGEPRRIEIWIHDADGTYFITGQPGHRDWYANLLEHPEFTVHVKESLRADLPARAVPVTEAEEKERLLRSAPRLAAHVTDATIADWLDRSPMVAVVFGDDD